MRIVPAVCEHSCWGIGIPGWLDFLFAMSSVVGYTGPVTKTVTQDRNVVSSRRDTEARKPGSHDGDIVEPSVRSRMMSAVKQKDTDAEIRVRKTLRELGISYRVRNRDLPGSPDIANRRRRWAIFVNGCFWHGHRNCPKTKAKRTSRIPASNKIFWAEKIAANRRRDARKCRQLRALGFKVLIIWECQLSTPHAIFRRLSQASL